MRHFIFLLFCMPLFAFAQQNDTIPKDSVINVWDLDIPVWRAWEKIDSVWKSEVYWPCLKKYHLKMNCAHCESIEMYVIFIIDAEGKLTGYQVVSSDKCGENFSKELENSFLEYFYKITFPVELRSKTIKTMLGTGLKC